MMITNEKQETLKAVLPTLRRWVDGFLIAKRASSASPATVAWYRKRLNHFTTYCEVRHVTTIDGVDASLLREYMLHLGDNGHNPGGVHGYYRGLKTLFLWYERETEPDGWRNPIRKVSSPKVPEEILEPVSLEDVTRLVATCGNDREGLRDRAILLTLLDTGARASELTGFDLGDFDAVTGELTIKRGKGGKGRTVFAGQKTRRAIRAYLKVRGSSAGALFSARSGGRLTYFGLRSMLQRRAKNAGIPEPTLHSFRRACALALLRAGIDLLTIQRLLGHSDLSVLKRYVKQTTDDLRSAVESHSPADLL